MGYLGRSENRVPLLNSPAAEGGRGGSGIGTRGIARSLACLEMRLDGGGASLQDAGMWYRAFVQQWIAALARRKLQETVVEAARQQFSGTGEPIRPPWPVDVAVVFALSSESGGLEDLLDELVATKAEGFTVRHGDLKRRGVVVAVSGAGRLRAQRATEALIAGHRPPWVISAGFCGGLSPEVKRHDVVVADAVMNTEGQRWEIDVGRLGAAILDRPGVHVGTLVEVPRILRLPREKHALGERHQALGADLESVAVAEKCRERSVRFLAIRAVTDAVDEKLPPEVENLVRQKTRTGQWGAALGAILNRPGSVKDLYKLQENALAASDRLARYLAAVIQTLAPLPPDGAADR